MNAVSTKHMTKQLPSLREAIARQAQPDSGIPRELIKAIAAEIGRGTVAYVEVMYPEAIKATSSTFKLSLRNHVYNDIMAIAELHDAGEIQVRLDVLARHRRKWVAMYRKMRRQKP